MLLIDPVGYEQVSAFCREYKDHPDFPALIDRIFAVRPEMKCHLDKMIDDVVKSAATVPDYVPYAKKAKSGKTGGKKKSKPAQLIRLVANANPRPVSNKPRVKLNGKSGRKIGPKHVSSICKFTDPFCPAAKNAKWPDGTAGNTMTEQLRGNFTLTSLASGHQCVLFAPQVSYGYAVGVSSVAGPPATVTMPAVYTAYSSGALVHSVGQRYRIVSFGVICRVISPATSTSGIVTFGSGAGIAGISETITLGTEVYPEVSVMSLQPGAEFAWISQPHGTGARNFIPKGTSVPAATDAAEADWTMLTVEVAGAPASTAVLSFEYFLNIEYTVDRASNLVNFTKPNPPMNSTVLSSVSAVHSTLGSMITGGVEAVEKSVMSHAQKALESVLADPLESLASLFL